MRKAKQSPEPSTLFVALTPWGIGKYKDMYFYTPVEYTSSSNWSRPYKTFRGALNALARRIHKHELLNETATRMEPLASRQRIERQ